MSLTQVVREISWDVVLKHRVSMSLQKQKEKIEYNIKSKRGSLSMLKHKLTAWPLSHPLLPGTWVVCVPDEALLFSQAPLHTHPHTYALRLKVLGFFSLTKCLPFCDMLAFYKTKTPQSTTQIIDSPLYKNEQIRKNQDPDKISTLC